MTDCERVMTGIIVRQPTTKLQFDQIRASICGQLKIKQPPNRELLEVYRRLVQTKKIHADKTMERLLRKAEVRSLSGIAVVTSLVKPYSCPGQCVFCPTEARMPKSYIATEPAAARALALKFNPYEQMRQRILMLERNGHSTDKIEYIIKGGTWNAYPLAYQYWFVLESFKAANETRLIIDNRSSAKRTQSLNEKSPINKLQKSLEKEQRRNEKARHRIIGLTFETRPDAISPKTIYHMRQLGCTRVELGLQATDDKILKLVKRGHTVEQFRQAMHMLRQAGFKVDLHFMPDLPGSSPKHDVAMYRKLFTDPGLKPDMVKIYPNVVIKSAELYKWLLDGRYKPYGDTPALTEALIKMKLATPRYCRISRLIRDIPATEISGGNRVTNLRELLAKLLAVAGKHCVCLRCREVGRQGLKLSANTNPQLFIESYDTTGGTEFFLSYEDKKRRAVFGFLRLRLPDKSNPNNLLQLLPEIHDASFIRELHVYGRLVKIGARDIRAEQHKGLGSKLMRAAEKIAFKHGYTKLAVISGIGVRDYYRKLGYRKNASYMIKKLKPRNNKPRNY